MRKLFKLFLVMLSVIAFTGCDDNESVEPKLNVIIANTNFQASGGEGYIQLQTTGNVTAEVNADWCTLKEVNSIKVEFEVDENLGYSGRNALLTISNGTENRTFTINQAGAVFAYDKNAWMLRTSNQAASLPIKIYSSFDYIVDIPQEARSWLSFQPDADGKKGKFVVGENKTGDMRGAIVSIKAKDRSTTYQVIQYDVEDMTGIWQGVYSDGMGNYGLKDVKIEKAIDGTYLLSNILTGLPYQLKAKAVDNCLAFKAGQNLGAFEDAYLSFEIISSDMYYVKDPSATISLGPIMMTDGRIIIAFSGITENDPYGFVIRVYEEAELKTPRKDLDLFLNCFLLKEDITTE